MQDKKMNRQFAADLDTDLARGHVLEWAELYALDAISDDERVAIDTFLDDADPEISATFADRVRTCRETVVSTYATAQVDPPADLFDRIVAQLPTTLGQSTGPTLHRPTEPDIESGPGERTSAATAVQSAAGQDELARRRSARTSVSSRAGRWVVAAAAAVVIAVGGVTVAQNVGETSVEQQVLQASDVRTGSLQLDAGGTAELAISEEEDAAVVTLSNVPAPAEGSVYQMWQLPVDGSAPVSVGTMTGADVAGTKVTELTDISDFSAIALTVEPEGGSDTPTLPIVAEISLRA